MDAPFNKQSSPVPHLYKQALPTPGITNASDPFMQSEDQPQSHTDLHSVLILTDCETFITPIYLPNIPLKNKMYICL